MYASSYLHRHGRDYMDARNRLLDAALDEFHNNGYKGATTRAIAQRAKVNEVTLFRHFGTKKNLFRAVIDRDLDLTESINKLPKLGGDNLEEDLVKLGLYLTKHMRKRSRVSKLIILDWSHVGFQELETHLPLAIRRLETLFKAMGAKEPYITAIAFQSFLLRSVLFESFFGEDPFVKLNKRNLHRFAGLIVNGMKGGD